MIRRRLTVTIVVLVALIGGLTATVFLAVLEARLVAGVDRELGRLRAEAGRLVVQLERPGERGIRPLDIRGIAYVRVGPDGEVLASEPSGSTADPDPLPDLAGLTAPSGPRTVASSGSGPRYRVVTFAPPRGGMLVVGVSLADSDATLANARRVLLAAALGALVATAVATWWATRRGLRPIDRMVATAEAIADGDIAERVEVADPAGEVGQLGSALNRMLDQIGEALAAQAASDQRMRRFVADAAHELRTPLTAIRGYAELHGRTGDDPATVTAAMRRIEQAATRMAGLVDDLVLLARLDQGRELEQAPVDVAAVVAESIEDARVVEPGRAIRVEWAEGPSVAGAVPAVALGDQSGLRQIVDNLLANVREHTTPATRVTITIAAHRREVVLVVADDGPGMTPDDAGRAFDRFWQAAATEEHPRRGTGLGLAIVADLVAAHGGGVSLDSAPGAGTRVTIRLPRAGEPGELPADSQVVVN